MRDLVWLTSVPEMTALSPWVMTFDLLSLLSWHSPATDATRKSARCIMGHGRLRLTLHWAGLPSGGVFDHFLENMASFPLHHRAQ